jgi:competence CoiA-like predicted nuclease
VQAQQQTVRQTARKREAADLAQDYAAKVKKQRQVPEKKELVKQRLMEQYGQQKRQNKQLREKLEQTEQVVQQFISEMGFLIDSGDAVQQPAASTRVVAGPGLAAGRNGVQATRTHYAGGGSGESTGGSASIF